MQFAAIDDAIIHYSFRPPAAGWPTLVFSNSLGTDFRIWTEVADMLPSALGVLRYDKRGHGLSENGENDDDLTRHVDDLSGLISHCGVASHVVCGLSVGGVIAQAYALETPHDLIAVVLCCTGPKIATPTIWDERIATVQEGSIEALADAVMERWFSPRFRSEHSSHVAGARVMLTRQPDESYAGICRLLRAADLTDDIGSIALPVLCVSGETDLSTPPSLVDAMSQAIPGSRHFSIPGVGHMPCIEAPEVLANAISAFLSAHGLLRAQNSARP